MLPLPRCQAFRRVFLFPLLLSLLFLAGCQSYGGFPYTSPWSFSKQEAHQQNAQAETTQRPEIDWQTAEKRQSLEVYYHEAAREAAAQQGRDYSRQLEQERRYQQRFGRDGTVSSEILKPPAGSPEYERGPSAVPALGQNEVAVALLLPLSGQHGKLGKSMMQAAQMALFDLDSSKFRLMPKDTKGTPEGAAAAAQDAIAEGAQLILGPLFSESVKAVKSVTEPRGVPMIAYTTDWKAAGRNTYVMGFLPFSQVIRVTNYALHKGYNNIGFFGPGNEYATIVLRTLHYSLQQNGYHIAKIGNFSMAQPDLHETVREFLEAPAIVKGKKGAAAAQEYVPPFDAVMIPVGGQTLQSVSNMFSYYNAPQKRVRLLGTGLWDDPTLVNEQTLHGAWFAASDPSLRRDFDANFDTNFGKEPERLASLAYDSTALAIVLAKTHNGYGSPYARDRIVTPQGFAGIDGIFRFRPDNLVERGLAVLQITSGGLKVIDPAPKAFFVATN